MRHPSQRLGELEKGNFMFCNNSPWAENKENYCGWKEDLTRSSKKVMSHWWSVSGRSKNIQKRRAQSQGKSTFYLS